MLTGRLVPSFPLNQLSSGQVFISDFDREVGPVFASNSAVFWTAFSSRILVGPVFPSEPAAAAAAAVAAAVVVVLSKTGTHLVVLGALLKVLQWISGARNPCLEQWLQDSSRDNLEFHAFVARYRCCSRRLQAWPTLYACKLAHHLLKSHRLEACRSHRLRAWTGR